MSFNLISDLNRNAAHAALDERALHYGDGLFETMLLKDGAIRYWDDHFARLRDGAKRLNIDCPQQPWLNRQIEPFIDLKQDLVIKLMLTRGSGGRGLRLPDETSPNLYLLHYSYNKSTLNQPVKVFYSSNLLPVNQALAGIKHLNRLNYVLATDELDHYPEYNEALLTNENGDVIESIVHNLFFVKDGCIHTPQLTHSGVEGIMRRQIIKLLKRSGKTVKIDDYSSQDVDSADECFLCNSVQGIRPIIRIEHREYQAGPVTLSLQQEIHGTQGN